MDWKLEVIVLPVSDVDRAKAFYVAGSASTWTSTTTPATPSGSCR
jgi:hypothetical protein